MGAGASTKASLNLSEIQTALFKTNFTGSFIISSDLSKEPISEYSKSTNSSETTFANCANSETFRSQKFMEFIAKCKDGKMSLKDGNDYVVLYPLSLFAVDVDNKSAIQYAGENKDLSLFHLLIKRKQEFRKKQTEKMHFETLDE